MKNFIAIVFFLSILQSLSCFQLQGTWSIAEIKGFPVIYESVTIQVSDSVYRSTNILQNIVFSGCQSYQYMMEFNQNNLFVSYSSIQFNQLPVNSTTSVTKCTLDAAKMHSAIRSNLVQVFYFQLIGNYLVLLNPKRQVVFKFQRVQSPKIRNLRGIWNITSIKGTKTQQKIQIADTEMTLCSGKLVLGYILSDKYGFKTRLIQRDNNSGCQIKDIDKYMLSSAFSRRIGNVLEIYDNELNLLMVMSFVGDIDLSVKQAYRLKAIEQAKKSQQQAALIQQQKHQQLKENQSALMKSQYQQQSLQLTLTLTNTNSDLLGIWQPVSVMGIPISTQTNTYYFIISTNTISINGGCNNFQFQYNVLINSNNINNNNNNNKVKNIQIGQNKSSSDKCKVDDDGLYVNGMVRVKGYSVNVMGNEIRLRLTDGNGNVVYEVRKAVAGQQQQQSSNVVNTIPKSPSPSYSSTDITQSPDSFQNGKYVFLILARRDLPRKFCTISNNKITYSGCNTIQHTIKTLPNNLLQITGRPITNNTCSINNDSIMINAFNSITSFTSGKEAGSYLLKSSNNVDVINFSLF